MNTGPESEYILDSNTDNIVDSGFVFSYISPPESNSAFKSTPDAPKKIPVRFPLGSPEWLVHCIQTANVPRAVGELRAWLPNSRQQEATDENILAIRKLEVPDAIEAVKSFKRKKFVRGTKGKDLKFSVTIENIHNGIITEANALLDCGATGSCVNKAFVDKYQLSVKKLPIKMPVYNADGTLNAGGAIEGFTEVKMTIGDHSERIELAVTNLDKINIFLGLDWLRFHNPTIDWTESIVTFDRCPAKCGYIPWWKNPEEGETLII